MPAPLTQKHNPSAAKKSFRPEIQGLRALAVLLVAAYHLWLGRVSGGVDVFLLISAFLMTGSFARKLEAGEKIGARALMRYWAHTFKRILPLATVTVLLVLLGTWYFLPAPRWAGIADEAKSVVFYRENWWSIQNMVDYYAADSSEASPLRHFWSLSVQGQIFLLWPLIFMLAWAICRFTKLKPRLLLFLLFGAIFSVSLTYSVYLTNLNQQVAYFSTWTRLWEFAFGSLIALSLPWIKAPARVRYWAGWAGIAVLLSCGFLLDVEAQFPGYIALVPLLAAAAIIFSGGSEKPQGAEKFLSHPVLLWVGKYSYGLYLIHWPLLVFYLFTADREKASFLAGCVLLAVSLLGSFVLTGLVEKPLRALPWFDARAWRSATVVVACSSLVVTTANAWTGYNDKVNEETLAQSAHDNPGALVLDQDYVFEGDGDAGYIPISTKRFDDRPLFDGDCAHPLLDTEEYAGYICYQLTEPRPGQKTVLAVGNSHMEQWMEVLTDIAENQNWNLQFAQYNDCYLLEPERSRAQEAGCYEWVDKTKAYVDAVQPDELITIGTISTYDDEEIVPAQLAGYLAHLESRGIGVLALRDNPRFATTHADCETRARDLCEFESVFATTENPLKTYELHYENFATVDMNDMICPNEACPSVIGNVYVYRDDSHLTRTFVASTRSYLEQRILEALEKRDRVHPADPH